jgi:hypothetical protein
MLDISGRRGEHGAGLGAVVSKPQFRELSGRMWVNALSTLPPSGTLNRCPSASSFAVSSATLSLIR